MCANVTHFAFPEGCCWRWLIWPWMFQSVQLSHILLSQRGVVGACPSGLGCATVTHVALPEGCCWRCLTWPWMLQSVQLSHILLSQRGAVGAYRSGFECSKACNCHPFCSPRGMLSAVFDLALGAPKYEVVTIFALAEGCCWRCLIWPWMLQSVVLSRILLSQRGAVGGV